MFFSKSESIRGKVAVVGQNCSISEELVVFGQKWLHLGKVVVIGQSGCNLAKVVVFVQKWMYLCKSGCIRARWLF